MNFIKRWEKWIESGPKGRCAPVAPEPVLARLRTLRARIPLAGDTFGDPFTRVIIKIGRRVE